jgi:hypothetical protein
MAKVKIKGVGSTCYVDLLHGIYNKGITSKRLKIGKEIEEEEVVTLFGPCSCNGYRYCHYEDKSFHFQSRDLVDDHAPKNPTLE